MRVLVPWKKASNDSESDQEHSTHDSDSVDHLHTESQPESGISTRSVGDYTIEKACLSVSLSAVEQQSATDKTHSSVSFGVAEQSHCQPKAPASQTTPPLSNEITSSDRFRTSELSDNLVSDAAAAEEGKSPAVFTSSPKLPRNTKKRPRSFHSKPPPMTGGGKIRRAGFDERNGSSSDSSEVYENNPLGWADKDSPHEQPLENEPPVIQNHHHLLQQQKANKAIIIKIAPATKAEKFVPDEDDDDVDDDDLVHQEGKKHAKFSLKTPTPTDWAFQQALKKRGLEIVEQEGDGNCLFRAVSLQVYGDSSMHGEVRERCLDFMERDPEHFAPFIAMDDTDTFSVVESDNSFASYIARKRRLGIHGNNPEIQAISELFNRPVEVFTPERGAIPLNIFQSSYKTTDVPIRLSYHDGNHYNAVIDPLVPTAGLGLGMPGLQPGLADKMQLAKAVVESDYMADEMELEKALQASKDDELKRAIEESQSSLMDEYDQKVMAQSDLETANFELEQKVLMNSLESYRRHEHGRKQRASPPAAARQEQASAISTGVLPDFAADPAASVAACAHASLSCASASVSTAEASSSSNAALSFPPVVAAALSGDEYPPTVQELVMNGFELRKVVHAYELIGDDFDDLLAFLMSSN